MSSPIEKFRRTLALVALILAGEAIFFLPFVMARIFRPTLLIVFNISNTELGTFFSVYGIIALISYFLGGPLADRFPVRNLMAIALWLTSLGGFFMAIIPGKVFMLALYAFWGITTILLFWAALIRGTREWGGKKFQGRAFGWLEGGRGLTAALIGTLSLLLFSDLMSDHASVSFSAQRIVAFKRVIIATSFITLASGILIWFFVPKVTSKILSPPPITLSSFKRFFTKPAIIILSIIIVCGYVGYKITDIFSLYANEILGFSEVKSAGVGTVALWMRAIVAVFAGYIADKTCANKIITISFALSIFGAFLIAAGVVNAIIVLALLNLVLIMAGIYGVRALYFALISEANLSLASTGTIVGIVSLVGFTPDIFMGPWMGYLLDNNPGITGHQLVFLVLTAFSCIGLTASLLFNRIKSH